MPELWVRFDKDEAAILGDAYVDLIKLTESRFDAAFVAHGHKPLLDLMGVTTDEHEALNDCMPVDLRRPWSPEHSPWTSAETGLAMYRNVPEPASRHGRAA